MQFNGPPSKRVCFGECTKHSRTHTRAFWLDERQGWLTKIPLFSLLANVLYMRITYTGHESYPERPWYTRHARTDGGDHNAPTGAVQDRLARHDDNPPASRRISLDRPGTRVMVEPEMAERKRQQNNLRRQAKTDCLCTCCWPSFVAKVPCYAKWNTFVIYVVGSSATNLHPPPTQGLDRLDHA